jgi:ornithine carbamoyltransferase
MTRVGVCGYFAFQWNVWYIAFDDMPDFILMFGMAKPTREENMDLNKKVTFAETVFAQEVDGEMVLLDMNSENYFGLDAVGTDIWQAMQENETLQEVFETLLAQYDVEEEVLKRDLTAFVHQLEESGLVKVEVS